MPKLTVTVRIMPDGLPLTLKGRPAWALLELHRAGARGVTPIDRPAPRWSSYVHLLRQAGIAIETLHEPHGGPFAGLHGRYVLRTPVAILARSDIAEAAA